MNPQLRKAAAAARQVILGLASEQWGVEASALSLVNGSVVTKSGERSATIGSLTKGQKLLSTMAFARESHMDDLAHAAGEDPLAYRVRHLKDERLRAVFEAGADRFGWGKQKPAEGRGFGLGGGTEKGGYVAACAEVAVDRPSGRVRVVRVTEAFECGAVVNPNHLENQIEGCIVQGLGGALFEHIDFADGRILNPAFSSYRVPRFSDLPDLDIVVLDRKDLPSAGAGETPICGIAPAIGNAIFNATGTRIRSLPLVPDGFSG